MSNNVHSWLQAAQTQLEQAGIDTARLDCLVLLEYATRQGRAHLLAHPEQTLSATESAWLTSAIAKRTQHTPIAYITGNAEFYGRTFLVNKHTLVPRPETEALIDAALAAAASLPPHQKLRFIDIGTGSGAIATTLKLERPEADVVATDIGQKCLVIAQHTAEHLQASVTWKQGNLLEPVFDLSGEPQTILCCNLPYVPDDYEINRAAQAEPKLALFAGPDGLGAYRSLFLQLQQCAWQPAYIITESLPQQHTALAEIANTHGLSLVGTQDFIQTFKRSETPASL